MTTNSPGHSLPEPGPDAAQTDTLPTSTTSQNHSLNDASSTPSPLDNATRHIRIQKSFYPALVATFVALLIVSNINATKGVEIFGLVTDGAFFLFPLSYVIGDILSECYGFRATRRAVLIGFMILAAAMMCFWIGIHLPPAGFYENQEAFSTVLGTVPQLVLAGLSAYLVGQLLNAWVLVAIKRRTGEKSLWARLLGSTVVGEFADTLIFCSIAATAIGISTWGDFINFVIVGFVWKVGVEVALLPVTYRVIAWVKKREGYWAAEFAANGGRLH